jgi:hypothetical protein
MKGVSVRILAILFLLGSAAYSHSEQGLLILSPTTLW